MAARGLGVLTPIAPDSEGTGVAVWTVHESQRPQPIAFLEHVRDVRGGGSSEGDHAAMEPISNLMVSSVPVDLGAF